MLGDLFRILNSHKRTQNKRKLSEYIQSTRRVTLKKTKKNGHLSSVSVQRVGKVHTNINKRNLSTPHEENITIRYSHERRRLFIRKAKFQFTLISARNC